MTAHPDPASAGATALIKLARQARELAQLDNREAAHSREAARRLDGLDDSVEEIQTHLASMGPNGDGYEPVPSPQWWALTDAEMTAEVDRLAGWVARVFTPGYGHLSAQLGPCWRQHPLCLVALDLLSEMWNCLHDDPARTRGVLASQIELQTRILPAIADQLATETANCTQHPARPVRRS